MADQNNSSQPNADEQDDIRHAADEPTAVWDANALRDAGLGDLIKMPESEPAPAATRAERGARGPSIVVDEVAAGAKASAKGATASAGSGELGWGATLGLAAGLGAAVYLLIRFLK